PGRDATGSEQLRRLGRAKLDQPRRPLELERLLADRRATTTREAPTMRGVDAHRRERLLAGVLERELRDEDRQREGPQVRDAVQDDADLQPTGALVGLDLVAGEAVLAHR